MKKSRIRTFAIFVARYRHHLCKKVTKVAADSRAATNMTSTEISWQLVKIVDTPNALIGLGLLLDCPHPSGGSPQWQSQTVARGKGSP